MTASDRVAALVTLGITAAGTTAWLRWCHPRVKPPTRERAESADATNEPHPTRPLRVRRR